MRGPRPAGLTTNPSNTSTDGYTTDDGGIQAPITVTKSVSDLRTVAITGGKPLLIKRGVRLTGPSWSLAR